MRPGDVVADRFEIERLAGAGAMGLVFKAIDRRTNETVALKLMGSAGLPERFMRDRTLALAGVRERSMTGC